MKTEILFVEVEPSNEKYTHEVLFDLELEFKDYNHPIPSRESDVTHGNFELFKDDEHLDKKLEQLFTSGTGKWIVSYEDGRLLAKKIGFDGKEIIRVAEEIRERLNK